MGAGEDSDTGGDWEALHRKVEDQDLVISDIRRSYSTLARVNKEDKEQLKVAHERHLRDVEVLEQTRVLLEKSELKAKASAVAATDCERLTKRNVALEQQLAAFDTERATHKRSTRDLYGKVEVLRERLEDLEAYKISAAQQLAEAQSGLRSAQTELEAVSAQAALDASGRATAERTAGNLMQHTKQLEDQLRSVQKSLGSAEDLVEASREMVVIAEKKRRNAEVAQAAAFAAQEAAETRAAEAELRVASDAYEKKAVAEQLTADLDVQKNLATQVSERHPASLL
jgi:chromosome segregation ATPase